MLNFALNQCKNDIICISKYINNVICVDKYVSELSFSCCTEFDLYPKFHCEAGNVWNNPRRAVRVVK